MPVWMCDSGRGVVEVSGNAVEWYTTSSRQTWRDGKPKETDAATVSRLNKQLATWLSSLSPSMQRVRGLSPASAYMNVWYRSDDLHPHPDSQTGTPWNPAAVLDAMGAFTGRTHPDNVHAPAKSPIDCSHLVHDLFQAAGYSFEYTNTATWASRARTLGFVQLPPSALPQPGDVVLFDRHMGVVTAPGRFFGSQTSTGPACTTFGATAHDWGNAARPVLGYYRWVGPQM